MSPAAYSHGMSETFELRTAAQLRVFNAPATRAVFEAMLDVNERGDSARAIGERAGLSPESAHYHLKKLGRLGLAEEVGLRETGARPERLFGLTTKRVELRPGKRGPAYVREVVRGVRLMLRRAEREFAEASSAGPATDGLNTRPRVSRHVGWLTPDEVGQVDRLESRLAELLQRAEKRAEGEGREGRERVAITMTLAPIAWPGR